MTFSPYKPIERRSGQRAFSLLEIMVAVALLLIITVGLLAMFYQTQRAFRAGVNQKDVMEAARATMELLARELQQIAPGGSILATNFRQAESSAQLQTMPGSQDARDNRTFDLTFMRKENDNWISTTYWVSNPPAGTLYRAVRKSNILEALPLQNPMDQKVMDGIIHFQILPYDTNGVLVTVTTNDDVTVMTSGIEFRNREIPAYVDLELGVLEESALKRFRARQTPQSLAFLERQVGKVHVFRQRIPVRTSR